MMFKPVHLLKRLEPSIRPAYAGQTPAAPSAPLEGRSFDQLLALVSDGSIRSGRPVTIGYRAEQEFSDQQLDRLASAADRAESAGARHALLLMDGRGLVLDVARRRLDSELSGTEPERVVPLDAAVYVAGDDEWASDGTLRLPGTGLVPPAVAAQIQRVHEAHRSSLGTSTQESQPLDGPPAA